MRCLAKRGTPRRVPLQGTVAAMPDEPGSNVSPGADPGPWLTCLPGLGSWFATLFALWIGFTSGGWAQDELVTEFARAVALQKNGSLQEAVKAYQALLSRAPEYAEAQANLGVVLAQLGDYSGAVAAYQQALRLNPHLAPVWLNLGILYHRRGEFSRAVEALERFLAHSPSHLQARQLLGISLVEEGRDLQAAAELTKALEEEPREPAVLYSLGLAYLRLGNPRLREVLGKLSEFPEGTGPRHLLQGQWALLLHEYQRALTEFQAARALSPELPRLSYSLGLAYLQLGQHSKAISAFEEELQQRPGDFSTLFYLAHLEEREGRLERALDKARAALEQDPESGEANLLYGKILAQLGRPAEALPYVRRAVDANPQDADRRYQLARLYQRLDRKAEASAEYAEVQRLKKMRLEEDRARLQEPAP